MAVQRPFGSKDVDPATAYRGGRSYAFAVDRRGRPALPTLAALKKAAAPSGKLAIAGQMADVIHIQTNSAVRIGSTARLADLVFRCGQILDALADVVDGITAGLEASAVPAALKPHQRPLAGVLATLHDSLGRIATLVPSDQTEAAVAQTAFRLRQLDVRAAGLAAQAGLSWRSFLADNVGRGDDSPAGPPTARGLNILV